MNSGSSRYESQCYCSLDPDVSGGGPTICILRQNCPLNSCVDATVSYTKHSACWLSIRNTSSSRESRDEHSFPVHMLFTPAPSPTTPAAPVFEDKRQLIIKQLTLPFSHPVSVSSSRRGGGLIFNDCHPRHPECLPSVCT